MIRIYEAGVAILLMLVIFAQFITLSAGRLGEQWDSTGLDVEVKKALADYQTDLASEGFSKYSKIGDPDLLMVPSTEDIGYRLLVNGEPSENILPPSDAEVIASDVRVQYLSRDAPRLTRSFRRRLLRSDYIAEIGQTLDYDGVDELADLILGIIWDEGSEDVLEDRVSTLVGNQNDDGGWGFTREVESDALCTSLAVEALSAWTTKAGGDPLSDASVIEGICWLRDGVHADGGYGARERLESSIDMTAQALLAFHRAGLGADDPHIKAGLDFILAHQDPDGGFPRRPRAGSDVSATAIAVEALMALDAPQAAVGSALGYLEHQMVSDGSFTLSMDPMGYSGTYDLKLDSGYIVDCSIRGYEFWGRTTDDPIILIVDVYGTRENMTVVLRIERGRLELPENKQKLALAFSHNMTPDDTDWWILNAGNPHTAGQGDPVDDPRFQHEVDGPYTFITITDLVVPDEYVFFADSQDWLIAIVGDSVNTIQDNLGRGYNIGYWDAWMPVFPYGSILVWRSLGSPVANRVCLDLDEDLEFDDRRMGNLDTVNVLGREWEMKISWNAELSDLNFIRFRQIDTNLTRYYQPLRYNLSGIPESASGLYRFGMISSLNKPSFSRNYIVILRESEEEGYYDEAYIYDGTSWVLFPKGSTWIEGGTVWVVDIEGDFLSLTRRDSYSVTGLSGASNVSLSIEGDFLSVEVTPRGPRAIWLTLSDSTGELDRGLFTEDGREPFRTIFGTWGLPRETSKVYHALALAESWIVDANDFLLAHNMADSSQQAIKFSKRYNSVVEDLVSLQAWHRPGA